MRKVSSVLYLLFTIWVSAEAEPCQDSARTRALRPDSLNGGQLNEVQVIVLSRRLQSVLSPAQKLAGAALERSGNLSVSDALRFFSGIQLKDYGGVGGLKTVNIRSMGANHTAVFYDGLAISNAQNGQVDLGRFSLANMEEIALYNGQSTDLLQPALAYASASAIYLKTKVPVFKAGNINTDVALKTGSFSLINPAANMDFRIGRALVARLSTELLKSDGQYKFRYTNGVYDTTATRSNGDISAFRAELALFAPEKNKFSWNLKGYYYSSERGLPGAAVSNRFDYLQRQEDENKFLQAELRKDFSERYSLTLKAKYSEDFTRYTDPEYITIKGFLKNEYLQHAWYASAAQQYRLSKRISAGLSSDVQYNTLDANLYRFAYPRRLSILNALAIQSDMNRFSVQGNVLSTIVREDVQQYDRAGDREELSPSLLLAYKLLKDKNLVLRTFYKSIFRMPTFNDLYYTFSGNTLLNPEFTRQYDIGINYHYALKGSILKYLDVQSDAYHNQIKDKIVAVPGANLFRWTMLNLGSTAITGLESTIKVYAQATKNLRFSSALNYTYQSAKDADKNSNTYGDQIPYTPRHSGSCTVSVYTERWSINYSFVYTGERYSQSANIPVNYLQPWYTSDISAQYDLSGKRRKSKLIMRADLNNVLNQAYDVVLNFPMPGRNVRFSLNYKI